LGGTEYGAALKKQLAATATELKKQNGGTRAGKEAGAYERSGAGLRKRAPLSAHLDTARQGGQGRTVGVGEGLQKRFVGHRKVRALRL
jgi:hypothetical protein